MTLQLTLPPPVEERLNQEATRRGESNESVALKLLDQHLPQPHLSEEGSAAAVAMLERWMKEDECLTTEECAENEELYRNLDADRASNRPLFPPELKGITW